ncbi:MAG: type IX secretion system outer membrane channel protein PorV [Bacteroidales bacterium]|nr:type IX secretion system outer membrane channel protein PorV [Bacteroidales bacterium]
MRKYFLLVTLVILGISLSAQTYDELKITTGVPFLTITPDARGGGMGDIGAATTADISSIFYNAAKYSFAEKKSGLQLSYSPWLHKIASDMSINYLSGYFKIDENQAFAASLKYFAIGEIQFTNELGENITAFKPNEFALTTAYSMKLTETFSGAVALKFIYSNLTGGISTGGTTHPGIAVAGDLSFYLNQPMTIKNNDAEFRWGINLSNLGTKISYGTYIRPFIPANFRTGVGLRYFIDEYNTLEFGVEISKLMVPTPPTYNDAGDSILNGSDPDINTTEGIIRSFYDGQNFEEELHEIMFGFGAEYTYNNTVFIRTGLFYESPYKGGRRYVTTGVGFEFNVFNIDFSYLIPIYSHSPLEATLRFTLAFYFDRNLN